LLFQIRFRILKVVFGVSGVVFGVFRLVFRVSRPVFRVTRLVFRVTRLVFSVSRLVFSIAPSVFPASPPVILSSPPVILSSAVKIGAGERDCIFSWILNAFNLGCLDVLGHLLKDFYQVLSTTSSYCVKTLLFPLSLWLAIVSLVLPLHGQSVSELKLQKSSARTVGESVTTTPEPTGFSLIPSGSFTMGDALDGNYDAPTQTVNVSAFYMARNLTTKADWDTVRTWAVSNGYKDLAEGAGTASNHPVHTISWYQMVKYCNARSQKEGLTPVYYTDDAQTTIYKTGDVNMTDAQVKWTANGYRLPTEAEWEKAARGGLSGKRFPWGDTISQTQANYFEDASSYSYDLGSSGGNSTGSVEGRSPATSPVGSFPANGYGLYDMAGNVWQWCWDWYGPYDAGSPTDPRGVSSGTLRVDRGGGLESQAFYCRVASRNSDNPSGFYNVIGFRVARSSVN